MCAFSRWSHCSGKVYSSDDIRPAGMTASTTTTPYSSRAGTECVCLPAPTGPLWELDLQRTLSSPVAELVRLLVTWFVAREIQYQDVELQTGYVPCIM